MSRIFRPDDENKVFIARWNMLVRLLLVESSVKHIARSAMDYAGFEDGTSCYPSNERIARETGYNERTVRIAWSVLRGLGMAERVTQAISYKRIADEYELQIPGHWPNLPILGPHGRKFTCLGCGKLFNPQGNCTVNQLKTDKPGDDNVRFDLSKLVFCPAPRRTAGRAEDACQSKWDKRRTDSGQPTWNKMGSERWEQFREARGDDW